MASSQTPLIAWDFDGVIVDSINEVLLCAHAAADLGLEPSPEFKKNFLTHRYLIQQAGDFIPFAQWCNKPAGDPLDFVHSAQTPKNQRSKFFFETRTALIETLGAKWLELHSAFQSIKTYLDSLNEKDFVVVTHKNRDSVLRLIEYLALNLKRDRLYTGDSGLQKSEHLKQAQSDNGGRPIFFIDDSIKNLLEVKSNFSEARLYLATWGYIGPKDKDTAQANNIAAGDGSTLFSLIAESKA